MLGIAVVNPQHTPLEHPLPRDLGTHTHRSGSKTRSASVFRWAAGSLRQARVGSAAASDRPDCAEGTGYLELISPDQGGPMSKRDEQLLSRDIRGDLKVRQYLEAVRSDRSATGKDPGAVCVW